MRRARASKARRRLRPFFADQALVKMDKLGNPMAGGTVMRYALKNRGKYDKRKAKVERLNVRAAVVTFFEGPAKRLRITIRRRRFFSLWFCCGRFSFGLSGL